MGGLLIILYTTLFPFDFVAKDTRIIHDISTQFDARLLKLGLGDLLRNVLLFVPFGSGLAAWLQRQGLQSLAILISVLLISLGLSAAIEVLQTAFLADRKGSLSDILANGVGGAIGMLCYWLWGMTLLTFFARMTTRIQPYLTARVLVVSFVSYCALAVLLTLWLQKATNLHNWNTSFALAVGNEQTGDRPWQGTVSALMITDRVLDQVEVTQALASEAVPADVVAPVVATYWLVNGSSYPDRTGDLPKLTWQQGEPPAQTVSGAMLADGFWLSTRAPVTSLTRAIAHASQFTLAIVLASASPNQEGPARIVTISSDPFQRNLTIGQEGPNLSLRLRTSFTGQNGALPEVIVPNVFADGRQHLLVVTYDGQTLRFYLDETQNPHVLTFAPALTLFRYLLPVDAWIIRITGFHLWVYRVLYSALIFMPLGLLLALLMKKLQPRSMGWLVWGGTTLGASLLLTALATGGSLGLAQLAEDMLLAILFVTGMRVLIRRQPSA